MKDPKNVRLYLMDVLDYIHKIELATYQVSEDKFLSEFHTHDLVAFYVFQIGETVNRIPETVLLDYAEINWRKMINLRNLIGHNYRDIVQKQMWIVVSDHLKPLKETIQTMLTEVD